MPTLDEQVTGLIQRLTLYKKATASYVAGDMARSYLIGGNGHDGMFQKLRDASPDPEFLRERLGNHKLAIQITHTAYVNKAVKKWKNANKKGTTSNKVQIGKYENNTYRPDRVYRMVSDIGKTKILPPGFTAWTEQTLKTERDARRFYEIQARVSSRKWSNSQIISKGKTLDLLRESPNLSAARETLDETVSKLYKRSNDKGVAIRSESEATFNRLKVESLSDEVLNLVIRDREAYLKRGMDRVAALKLV